MEPLTQFQNSQNEQYSQLELDLALVRRAEKSGLEVQLMDSQGGTTCSPSAIKSIWCAVITVDGNCEWHSLGQFSENELHLAKEEDHGGGRFEFDPYYEGFKDIIHLYPILSQASLTKFARRGSPGVGYVYLYVYVMSDRDLPESGGGSSYPQPVQDEEKIREKILIWESKA